MNFVGPRTHCGQVNTECVEISQVVMSLPSMPDTRTMGIGPAAELQELRRLYEELERRRQMAQHALAVIEGALGLAPTSAVPVQQASEVSRAVALSLLPGSHGAQLSAERRWAVRPAAAVSAR
jgi:hypothetical protein